MRKRVIICNQGKLCDQFCLSVCQSVCQSVCPVKIFEISTFTRLKDCCKRQWHGNLKKNNVCVPDKDQSSSLLCISSSFLFNIGIVHHFDTVNHLDTVDTGHVLTPSTCSRSPASSFPGLQKAGQGPGNEATHLSGHTGEWNMTCY